MNERDLEGESAYMHERMNVSAEELIARNKNVPELGVGKGWLKWLSLLNAIAGRHPMTDGLKLSAGTIGGSQPKVLLTTGEWARPGALPVAVEVPQALLEALAAFDARPRDTSALQGHLAARLNDVPNPVPHISRRREDSVQGRD